MPSSMSSDLKSGSLVYHSEPKPGKLEIRATKPLGNQRDMALAYSPGVAEPKLIFKSPLYGTISYSFLALARCLVGLAKADRPPSGIAACDD